MAISASAAALTAETLDLSLTFMLTMALNSPPSVKPLIKQSPVHVSGGYSKDI